MKFDVAIVGGGIVGLATAYQLQINFPNLNLIILEKEDELAFHQSGRNSGVIHSGLYYKTGSMKAKNCVHGRNLLIDYAKKNNIEHDICGKLVVANNLNELKTLKQLKINGEKNGLTNLNILDSNQIKEIEPYVDVLSALHVPESGIIDYKKVTKHFAKDILSINNNSCIKLSCEVLDYKEENIKTNIGNFKARNIIFCGGLFADRLAKKDKIKLTMKIVSFRGDYFKLKDHCKFKVKNLVYPVPNPAFPFLGIHLTRMTNGDIECGPNAVFTFKREGYKKTDFNLKDTLNDLCFIGTMKLFINNWKFGLKEYQRAFSKSLFLDELNKMIPSLGINDIEKARSGVRAIALEQSGQIVDDFKIINKRNNIHVLSAPSPAATACLAIGENIMHEAIKHCKI